MVTSLSVSSMESVPCDKPLDEAIARDDITKMPVEATIGEPFALASYSSSSKVSAIHDRERQSRPLQNVCATYVSSPGSSSREGYATIAAQGDGVYVLDISALHPVISHASGPSTTFSCPPVTVISPADNNSGGASQHGAKETVFSTYVVVENSADLGVGENGRTVWMWRENLLGALEDRTAQKKKAVVTPHIISGLYPCEELPSRLLLISPKGDVSLVDDEELQLKASWCASPMEASSSAHPEAKNKDEGLLKAFVYALNRCSFVPTRDANAPQHGAVIVLFYVASGSWHKVRTTVLVVDAEDQIMELAQSHIPVPAANILDISFSTSGFISILRHDGSWNSYQLSSHMGESFTVTPSECLTLTGLSFPPSRSNPKPTSIQKMKTRPVSIVSLGSSHVMLAATTATPHPEVVVLLWDLQYAVLLASQSMPIPSSLAQSGDAVLDVELVPAGAAQVMLLLSPNTSSSASSRPTPRSKKQKTDSTTSVSSSTAIRSSVLVVPCTVPSASTIANALGRGEAGRKWIQQYSQKQNGPTMSSAIAEVGGYDAPKQKALEAMRVAVAKNLPQAANQAFFEWEKRIRGAKTSAQEPPPELDYAFVKDVLVTMLQPEKPADNMPYSSEVVRYLLERRVVSTAMLDGGLLGALRLRNDWQSVQLAMKTVLDLTESEIVDSLRVVIRHHGQEALQRRPHPYPSTGDSDDAMQVDDQPPSSNPPAQNQNAAAATGIPSLPAFLALFSVYPTTRETLRQTLQRSMKDTTELVPVLRVLEGWVASWVKRDLKLLPSKKDLMKNEQGVLLVRQKDKIKEKEKDKERWRDGELPPLDKVLTLLQTILDASFLDLLQHVPAHRTLRQVSKLIEPEIAFNEHTEQLRGFLEPFASVHSRAIREGMVTGRSGKGGRKEKRVADEGVEGGDWRQRKRIEQERVAMAVGLYQLEELVI